MGRTLIGSAIVELTSERQDNTRLSPFSPPHHTPPLPDPLTSSFLPFFYCTRESSNCQKENLIRTKDFLENQSKRFLSFFCFSPTTLILRWYLPNKLGGGRAFTTPTYKPTQSPSFLRGLTGSLTKIPVRNTLDAESVRRVDSLTTRHENRGAFLQHASYSAHAKPKSTSRAGRGG